MFGHYRRQPIIICRQVFRSISQNARDYRRKTILYYSTGLGIFMLGLGYAGVPLYRIYCAVNNYLHFSLQFYKCGRYLGFLRIFKLLCSVFYGMYGKPYVFLVSFAFTK